MRRKTKFQLFALVALLGCLLMNLIPHLFSKPVLYFGYSMTNSFQAKGDFYDPIKGHTGIDIGMPIGTALSMAIPLRVVDLRKQNEMGNCLYAEDAWGHILVFAHLSEIYPAVGDVIKADDFFALSGNTGTATKGPHLHFEIISEQAEAGYEIMTRSLGNYYGYNINPIDYLNLLPANIDS